VKKYLFFLILIDFVFSFSFQINSESLCVFEGSVSEGEAFDPSIYDEEILMYFPSFAALGTPAMEYVKEMSRFFPSSVF
jgi:hypothetical protein